MLEASTADYLIVIVFGIITVILAYRLQILTIRCTAHRYNITNLRERIEKLEAKG